MRLNDSLITEFEYNDKAYKIDLAFDNVLDVFDVLSDDDLREHEKAEISLSLLTGEDIKGIEAIELWNFVYKNYIKIASKQPIEYDIKGNPMPAQEDEEDEEYISLDQDAEYIYTSFQQAYGMNLINQQGKLHWHEFQTLLTGLPSDTIMQKIIQIRMWKPSKGESTEDKKNMSKLQKIYSLDVE